MKTFIGKVVSSGAKKTLKVEIGRTVIHPLYKKIMRRSTRLLAHNEIEGIKIGDMVRIGEVRPISKLKHFKVLDKIS